MINQFIDRYLGSFNPYLSSSTWCYEEGLMINAIIKLYEVFNEKHYYEIVMAYLDSHLDSEGKLVDLFDDEDDLHHFLIGKALFFAYKQTDKPKYKYAIDQLYSKLKNHPRNRIGNFLLSKKHNQQIYLDSIYFVLPFYALYAKETNNNESYDDIIKQIKNVNKYFFDIRTGLLVHGYDEAKKMKWADKSSGQSPNVYSKSLGLYLMTLIDLYEILKDNELYANTLAKMFIHLTFSVCTYQDRSTSLWYLLVDKRKLTNNYLETSGSAMISYSLMKGQRLGLLKNCYCNYGKQAFKGIVKHFLVKEDDIDNLINICEGVNIEKQNDASEGVYLSNDKVKNEAKGIAAFIMAYGEMLLSDN